MPAKLGIFNLSGPTHLTAVDWNNKDHRRSIAASLVQGVYILELDRQQNRQGPQALAPAWWDFFNFQLNHVLVDKVDNSIFGTIFESQFPASNCGNSETNTPKYVIAFRGTLTEPDTLLRDLKLDLGCIRNKLQLDTRFEIAMKFVKEMVDIAGATNVWLAGHSLGSAIALLAGKNMTKVGYNLETYLFNPPFFSIPIEGVKNQKVKDSIRFANSVVKAGLVVATKACKYNKLREDDESFDVLSAWFPYLFVNPNDPICSEYIGYFEHRKKMEEIGAGKVERLATKNSMRNLFLNALGRDLEEALHLLPSAYLITNLDQSPNFRRAHGLEQWWSPDTQCQLILYQFQ